MYALDASSGQPLWTFNINDPNPGDRSGFPGIQSSAAVVNGRVYFGAADANVYALDAQSGAMVWKTSLGNPDTSIEGAHVWSSPAVFNGKVYVGKSSHLDAPCVHGALVALDAASGAEVWRFETLPERVCSNNTQRPCSADADCSGGSCIPFLVCRSGSGEQAQSQLCSTGVAFGNIYAGTFTGPPFLFALSTTDGHSAWQCPSTECNSFSFGPAGIAAGVVFMGDSANSAPSTPRPERSARVNSYDDAAGVALCPVIFVM